VQTGPGFRFRKDMIADCKLGVSRTTAVPLAVAVAASSAFRPLFSPIMLADGVSDNMVLESLVDDVDLVPASDAGARFGVDESPHEDNLLQLGGVRDILIDRTRARCKRRPSAEFEGGCKHGACRGIGTHIAADGAVPRMADAPATSDALERVPTRPGSLDAECRGHPINWGCAPCDVSLRVHAGLPVPMATTWPAPEWPFRAAMGRPRQEQTGVHAKS
jgi:NTE family protein